MTHVGVAGVIGPGCETVAHGETYGLQQVLRGAVHLVTAQGVMKVALDVRLKRGRVGSGSGHGAGERVWSQRHVATSLQESSAGESGEKVRGQATACAAGTSRAGAARDGPVTCPQCA